jgi:hypothetical protein
MNDDRLRQRIRSRFVTGEPPTKRPVETWGGLATSKICADCDASIDGPAEIEADGADGQSRVDHPHCYQVLLLERQSPCNDCRTL